MVLPLVIVRVLPAILTLPAPDKAVIDAPLVAERTSKVPVTATEADVAIEPPSNNFSAPASMVVAPVKVLVLDSVRMPEPDLVRPPLPLPMVPERMVLPPPATVNRFAPLVKLPLNVEALVVLVLLIVAVPLRVTSFVEVKVPVPPIVNVPALIARLLAAPRLASASTLIAPPLMLVMPVLVLLPDSVKVPLPTLVRATVDAEPF